MHSNNGTFFWPQIFKPFASRQTMENSSERSQPTIIKKHFGKSRIVATPQSSLPDARFRLKHYHHSNKISVINNQQRLNTLEDVQQKVNVVMMQQFNPYETIQNTPHNQTQEGQTLQMESSIQENSFLPIKSSFSPKKQNEPSSPEIIKLKVVKKESGSRLKSSLLRSSQSMSNLGVHGGMHVRNFMTRNLKLKTTIASSNYSQAQQIYS